MTQQKRRRSHFHHLKRKWLKKHKDLHNKLWDKHGDSIQSLHTSAQNAVFGSMAGLLMLSHTTVPGIVDQFSPPEKETDHVKPKEKPAKTKETLIADLSKTLPEQVVPLSSEQEEEVGRILTEYFHVPAAAELDGKRLNRSYGIIGAEQHLMRYPGDTMETHFSSPEEAKYWSSGMAPGRGAWGYFVDSGVQMTQKDIDREKYYIAVQTFLSPGWDENVNEMYNFFRYRKILVVNPENGKGVVAVIGDAGPAVFTGKHLGGSPEVMGYLERQDGGAKGPVLYYFIDDPEDKIPLGPITIDETNHEGHIL
ncbi:MAG: hypothetical protein ACOCXQ_02075 [Patescibacteria group bacterium]